jgi:hypothetical protein
MAAFHDFSSSRIERHTVPEGYTLGWNNGGENLPVAKKHKSGQNRDRYMILNTNTLVASKDNLHAKTHQKLAVKVTDHSHLLGNSSVACTDLPPKGSSHFSVSIERDRTPHRGARANGACIVMLTPGFPGMPTSHSIRFIEPSAAFAGFA